MAVRRPTAEEVITRLKDDGDFDALRLKIVRKVKENEELRASIVSQVKQSVVLNEDGSEKLKIRQLSDAIYEELGTKIMGQISDEVWKTIKSNENDIKGSVETVYNRIVHPEPMKKESLPSKRKLTQGSNRTFRAPTKSEANVANANKQMEKPGFGPRAMADRVKFHSDHPQRSSSQEPKRMLQGDAISPGFGPGNGGSDEDPPPGFG